MPDTEFLFVSHYVESIASQCQGFCFALWNNLSTLLLPSPPFRRASNTCRHYFRMPIMSVKDNGAI